LTIVPNRNAMMLGIAFSVAVAEGAETVGFAAHGGDHFIYPDCRPDFIDAYERAMHLANDNHDLRLVTFVRFNKTDIARMGYELGVPFDLTWSCYKGGSRHCGVCGTCTERKEAFREAGLDDPTDYE
jgi:7-cyano-7-deazaguanine synthase